MLKTTALALLLASILCAQASRTATLVGTVSDPTGATVVGAAVTVVNMGTNFTFTGQSNESGRFYVPYLPPGSYQLTIEAAGFRTYLRKGIEVRSGESPRIDVQMELGAVAESVVVTGAAPLLETETATSGASLQNEVFMRVPVLQMRTFNILTYLPGVTNTGNNQFNALGLRNRSLGYTVDGISAKEPVRGPATDPTMTLQTTTDALEEVRVLTTGMPAEYGRAGSGMLIAVMKSGTNSLHGSAEDRYINNVTRHRKYFEQTIANAPFSYHELAATVGGPVVLPKLYDGRNKTFFFAAWQRHHEKNANSERQAVPSLEMLAGDFSFGGLGNPIFDPASTRLVNGVWTRDPFPQNRLPSARYDPVAKNFLANQPWFAPNAEGFTQASGPRENYAAVSKYRSYRSRFDSKVDHQVSKSQKFFVRYSYNWHSTWSNRGAALGLNWQTLNAAAVPTPIGYHNAVFSDTYTISPSTINEVRLGFNRRVSTREPDSYMQGWAQKLGIPNTLPDTFPEFAGIGFAVSPGGYSQAVSEDFTFSENLTKVISSHTLKMGWEVVRSRFNNLGEDRPSGIYNMGGTDFPFRPNTGNGFASFLLGSVASARFTQNRATWLPRWWTHGLYLQDDWKVTRNLTLNIGLRWTYESPYQTKYGQQSQFDPAVKDPITGRLGAITHTAGYLAKKDLNNFQPRLGLAWAFRPGFVFRSSFGVMTLDLMSPDANLAFEEYFAENNAQMPPGDPRVAFFLSQGPPKFEYNVNPDGTVPFVGTNYSARGSTWFDPNMRMPYVMSWSGGIQWQFAPTWLFETVYQGSSGVGLLNNWDYNVIPLDVSSDITVLDQIFRATQNYKPYPQFGSVTHYSNYSHSTYHGATFRLEKRYSAGMTLNTFYTFSKAINDADEESAVRGITFYNRSLEKAVATFDLRHRFVATVTYDLPVGKGRKYMNAGGWKDAVFGGWQLMWSHSMQSGLPITVTFAGSPNRYLPGVSRPDILAPFDQARVQDWNIGPNRFPTSAQLPLLNMRAFEYPSAYKAGNLGRNTFRGPWLLWPQASLSKEWAILERFRFTLRWDVNNVLKLPEFGRPGSVYDTRNPGTFARFTDIMGSLSSIGSQFHSVIGLRLVW
jgi:hypothetical protein